jgi:hypothetical protein
VRVAPGGGTVTAVGAAEFELSVDAACGFLSSLLYRDSTNRAAMMRTTMIPKFRTVFQR